MPRSARSKGLVLRTRANAARQETPRRPVLGLAALFACLIWGSFAAAVELTVQVQTPAGTPVRGAVVMLHGPPGTPAAKSVSVVVDQSRQGLQS